MTKRESLALGHVFMLKASLGSVANNFLSAHKKEPEMRIMTPTPDFL